MIVLDIETSGLDMLKCSIWQIGALDFDNPQDYFLQEGRIDEDDYVDPAALVLLGKTEAELRDKSKQSQRELISNFQRWVERLIGRNAVCQNPQFDFSWIETKCRKYDIKNLLKHRIFDLHSIAQSRYHDKHGKFLLDKEEGSAMNLSNILEMCGIPDKRREMRGSEIIREGTPHNALEDARLTAECLSRILYGKGKFQEFSEYAVPDYLIKR